MHIPRRLTLLGTCATLALASCNTPTSQVQMYADLITAGVVAFAPALRVKASPTQRSQIDVAVAAIQRADTALATATGQQATLNVQSIVAAVQAIAPIAIELLPPGSVEALAASAVVSLLPAILRAAGVTPAPTIAPPPMDEGRATAVLRAMK